MPELMLQYRSAAFFQRAYAPEISMGMQTAEEFEDMGYNYEEVHTKRTTAAPFDASALKTVADVNNALLRGQIGKEEAEHLREMITKRQAAADLIAASQGQATHAEAPTAEGGLFPKN